MLQRQGSRGAAAAVADNLTEVQAALSYQPDNGAGSSTILQQQSAPLDRRHGDSADGPRRSPRQNDGGQGRPCDALHAAVDRPSGTRRGRSGDALGPNTDLSGATCVVPGGAPSKAASSIKRGPGAGGRRAAAEERTFDEDDPAQVRQTRVPRHPWQERSCEVWVKSLKLLKQRFLLLLAKLPSRFLFCTPLAR